MTEAGLQAYIRVNFSGPIMRAFYLAVGFAVRLAAQTPRS